MEEFMANKIEFSEAVKQYNPLLKQYVPVVAKVHGNTHPEFYEVKAAYEDLVNKLKDPLSEKSEISTDFAKLRKITSNYKIPEDVCETYEAVYTMLSELDASYSG